MHRSTPSGLPMRIRTPALAFVAMLPALSLAGQEETRELVRLEAEPAELRMELGESADVAVTGVGADGDPVAVRLRFTGPPGALGVNEGRVTGLEVGAHELVVTPLPTPAVRWDPERPPTLRIPVTVDWPPVAEVSVGADPGTLYAGTTLRHRARVLHADGSPRPDARVAWSTSDRAVATVDRFGAVTAHRPGTVRVIAESEGERGEVRHEVRPLPAVRLDISLPTDRARTGEVVELVAAAMAADGSVVRDVPITWSVAFEPRPEDGLHAGGGGGRLQGGRFVAETPGRYTLLAQAGTLVARQVLEVTPRQAEGRLRVVARVGDDTDALADIRTWEAAGDAGALTASVDAPHVHLWDLSDPAAPRRTTTVEVGGAVRGIAVEPGGRYAAVLTSAVNAGDAGDAVVLIDLAEPAEPRPTSRHRLPQRGGIQRMIATPGHLHLVNTDGRLSILDVSDVRQPREAGSYQVPGGRIHDARVDEGVAYLAVGRVGIVVVDLGGGGRGGTAEDPERMARIAAPAGAIHTVELGRLESGLHLIAGEPGGMHHLVDVADRDAPELVARVALPESEVGQIRVLGDALVRAAGVRGVQAFDLSGELMADLHRQGREMDGIPANVRAADVLGGHLYIIDGEGRMIVAALD